MNFKSILFLSLLLSATLTYSQNNANNSGNDLPVNNDFVNFNNIKNILKTDGLEKVVEEKKKVEVKKKILKEDTTKALYETPSNEDFWPLMLQYWLVKNTAILKWDFDKPEFGVSQVFTSILKEVGELGINYKILYLNTSNITHFAFPLGKDSYLFLISVPFIKSIDLSKIQIALMMYEDLIRVKKGYFESMIKPEILKNLRGRNFYKDVVPTNDIKNFLDEVDQIVYSKGFNFQQQYQVTQYVNSVLLNNKKYWQNYYNLLYRIDDLVKSNMMYKNYAKIYPSPELQLNWIDPTKKK